ncbi:MAG: DNA primase, partial [Mycoplasma sp.]|nr:DNA primase [Mycoplasma sp.]
MKDLINQIKQKMNIVTIIGQYLNLQKKGTSFLATCPFHSDTNPSLTISEKKQIFKCFVCNVGGDGINFVAQYEKISYLEALKKLANLLNIEYKFNFNNKKINYTKEQEEVLNVLKDANDYFMNLIFSVKGKIGFEYCKKRNLEPKLIEIFKIGYKDESSNLYDFLLSKNHNEDAIINSNLFRKSNKCWFDNRLIFALTNDEGDIVGFTGRILK